MSRWIASCSMCRPSLVARTLFATEANLGLSVSRFHCTSLPIARYTKPSEAGYTFVGMNLRCRLPARVISLGSQDRKSTRLNSSHLSISYAVFCLEKKRRSASSRQTRMSGTCRITILHTYGDHRTGEFTHRFFTRGSKWVWGEIGRAHV